MRLQPKTPYNSEWEDLERFIDADEKKRIEGVAAKYYLGDGGYYNLSVSQFIKLTANNISALDAVPLELGTVFCVYFINGLRDFLESYIKLLERYTVKSSEKDKLAASGCAKMSIGESLLIFVRGYFGLHSFAEAEKVTLDELLIAKRDTYNNIVFERAKSAQQIAEYRKRR